MATVHKAASLIAARIKTIETRPLAKPVKATGRQGLWNWTPPDGVCENIPAACIIPGMEVQNA